MSFVLLVLSVFAACIPIVLYVCIIWWLDRYEREPPVMVLAAFCWGAIYAVLLALFGSSLATLPFGTLEESTRALVQTVVVAPLAEEPAKAFVLLLLLRRRQFDGPTDGIVYGATAGLGFGMTENFLYFASTAIEGDVMSWVGVVMIRTCLTAPMHAMTTAIVGAGLGWAKFRGTSSLALAGGLCLVAAWCIHGFWNGMLSFDGVAGASGGMVLLAIVLMTGGLLLMVTLFLLSVNFEGQQIRKELLREADVGTFDRATAEAMFRWSTRRRGQWAPPGLAIDRYIQLAMTLALRRHQVGFAGPHRDEYTQEIHHIRAQMTLMWNKAEGAQVSVKEATL